ncbi:hypothetical protein [uncultured Clostridium sp.]|uniref:hypothetical protein n=1 Tax=uncultured Clostridium sp. TaxID=59620 RepID=UPI0026330616|nr:hypothetical protein [uncultured Clostridium sp.]
MIFSKKNKEGNRAINLGFVDGVESYSKGTAVELSMDDKSQYLIMKARIFKDKPIIKLKYSQILAVNVITEKEIIENNKSVVGRAVVGGVLLGPLGAIIAGMSGVGSKTKSNNHYFMVINYKSSTGEIKVLSLEILGASLHWSSFLKELRTKIDLNEISNVIEKEMYL